MGEIINLNKAKKVRAKAKAKTDAAANRAVHGRSGADVTKAEAEKTQQNHLLDGAKRERPEEDET